jgi:outer membrane protein assembly factor BamB
MVNLGQRLSTLLGKTSTDWTRLVGRMHWRNNILGSGDRIILSTSGRYWNDDDPEDGVLCLSSASGDTIWKFHTVGDANEVSLFDTFVLVGTDRGYVYAIDKDTGASVDQTQLEGPVYVQSVVVQVNGNLWRSRHL